MLASFSSLQLTNPPCIPAKKFRDFLNHTAYLDLKPNDDVTDILGFLSFEMVRTVCVAALDIRRGLSDDPNQAVGNAAKIDAANRTDQVEDGSLRDADKVDESAQPSTAASPGGDARPAHGTTTNAHRLAPAPPLQPRYILAAYQKAQRDEMSVRTGGMGLRNFRGGVVRRKVAII
jgi:transcription initiation protein SPT3